MKPTSQACREKKCPELITREYHTCAGARKSYYCRKTDKIPGNMSKCPAGKY